MTDVKTVFGETLRKYRTKSNRSQQDVATRCDMSFRYYQELEAGTKQPTITTPCNWLKMRHNHLIVTLLLRGYSLASPCRKSTAFCACDAALKINFLLFLSACSQDLI
nr:helix-turn-helix transcriptional regulator [Teredinibacter waterburyi]